MGCWWLAVCKGVVVSRAGLGDSSSDDPRDVSTRTHHQNLAERDKKIEKHLTVAKEEPLTAGKMFSIAAKQITYWFDSKNDLFLFVFLKPLWLHGYSWGTDLCYIKDVAFFVASSSLFRRRIEEWETQWRSLFQCKSIVDNCSFKIFSTPSWTKIKE